MGSSSKSQTTGYRYYMGIHMGVGRGPVDELVAISAGDRLLWSGSVTGNQTIYINRPDVFGGDKGEGGIQGTLDVLMGGPSQVAPAGLTGMLGGLVPGFRGVMTAFFNGLICSNNPYPKAWKIRRRRATAGWDGAPWYPEKAVIWMGTGTGTDGIRAMNPAHIIFELHTNRDWGRCMDRARIDEASFLAAANQLFDEGFGLCLQWSRQGSIQEFLQLVLDHIGAVCGPDMSTGKIRLKLLRDDADPDAVPLFDYDSGLLDIEDETSAAGDTLYNEVNVSWIDPIPLGGEEKLAPPVMNLGSIQNTGRRSTSKEYPGIPTEELAIRVAMRDLAAVASGLKRFKLQMDRRAYALQTGDVLKISAAERGIEGMILRIIKREEAATTDGAITLTCIQDVFGLPDTVYVEPQPPGWVPPDTTPVVPSNRLLLEVPYYELARRLDPANIEGLDPTSCFLAGIAVRPGGLALDFGLATRLGSDPFVVRGRGDWTPTALVVGAASKTTTAVTVTAAIDLDFVEVGAAVLWDGEIVRVDAINASTGELTLARGCADTVPVAHAASSRLWFFDSTMATDSLEYLSGESVNAKLLTRTSTAELDPALAPTNTLVMARRQSRPYPPGRLRISGAAYPSLVDGSVDVAWRHRNRLLQADHLVDTEQDSVSVESGVTYTARLLRADTMAELVSVTGITGTTAGLTTSYIGQVIVEVWAIRAGLESWQRHQHTFDLVTTRLTEDGDQRITEDGDVRYVG